MNSQGTLTLKICLVGSPRVGKTSLREKFMGNKFKSKYLPTIGSDFSMKSYSIGGQSYQLLIWDLAGEKKFEKIRTLYFSGAFGIVLVFDLTNEQSFKDLDRWIEDVETTTPTHGLPLVLLGNKIDLVLTDQDMAVSQEKIDDYVMMLNQRYKNKFKVHFLKTSALTGENIDDAFTSLIQQIRFWLPYRRI